MINLLSFYSTNSKNLVNNNDDNQQKKYFLPQNVITSIYNDDINKKDYKSRRLGLIMSISAAFVAGMVFLSTKGLPKNIYRNLEQYIKNASKNYANNHKSFIDKLNNLLERSKAINNFTSLKDILFMNMMKSNKVLSNIHYKITSLFEKMASVTVKRRYIVADEKFNDILNILKKSKNIPDNLVCEVEKLYKNAFSLDVVTKRHQNMQKVCKNLDKKVLSSAANGMTNIGSVRENLNHFKKSNVHKIFIAEDILSKDKNALADSVSISRNLLKTKLEELLKNSKEKVSIDEYNMLSKNINKFIKKLDNANITETDEFFDKLRDLSLGSAPTDVLKIFSSLLGVGIGLIHADNREERISATLKYGIPVVGGVATSLLMTVSLLSGLKALGTGIFMSYLMNRLGTGVDNHRKRFNKNEIDNIYAEGLKIKSESKSKLANV